MADEQPEPEQTEEPPGEWPAGTKEDEDGKQVLTEH